MSLISGIRGFSVSMYGQSGIVMDWFGLNDPFTQQVPLKITNAYSGTLWFQSYLSSPRSGYYNYSGIQMGLVNSGASTTLVMTWDAGISGWITTSSPITDTLTLNITTYTSSNYTGSYSSGNFTFFNTLFNRYSGVIKVFGDIYSNDNPIPSVAQGTTGTLVNGQNYSYAISYILSGWESDVSAAGGPTAPNSGSLAISWSAIAGATQYFVWRWADTIDFTGYSGGTFGSLRVIGLAGVVTTNSYTDTGGTLQAGMFRHRNWQRQGTTNAAVASVATYLSAPESRQLTNLTFWAHGYQLGKNASGTNLLGPFYMTLHYRFDGPIDGVRLTSNNDGYISGTTIGDANALTNQVSGVWYRQAIQLGASGTLSSSGLVHVQLDTGGETNVDDIFVVTLS